MDAPAPKWVRKASRRSPQGIQAPAEQRADLLAGQDNGDGKKNVAIITAQLKLLEGVATNDVSPNQPIAAQITKFGFPDGTTVESVRNAITMAAKMVIVGFGLSNRTKQDDQIIRYGPHCRHPVHEHPGSAG